ncbi:hypothetical protein R3W88_005185 [Solanum pinnatisectum]|uniref:Uncharacterized protein n=1 Tax=Solanum pinnatisectum TaxID=50273 RepID=A0AAV9KBV0_9SOLN|nr:hypothetical protein R3W88_005185 [Solanum pinnatisectum]
MHMHSYWASIFMLPKNVLKDITAICRNYIWSGKVVTNRPLPLIAWDKVCKPKNGWLKVESGRVKLAIG